MKRLKGPDLKMPELKVPPFLVDLFYDLRDRRLLPLVALAIVAIVAVPFLLGGDSEQPPPAPAAAGSASASSAPGSEAARLTVVEAAPGLRDYRKRLAGRGPTDPFKQRYTGPVLKGAKLNSQTTTTSTSSSTGTTTTTSTGFESPTSTSTGASPASPAPAGGGDGGEEPQLTFFTFAIDVKISRSDGGGSDRVTETSEPTIRERVMPRTPLPGKKTPVVTYMGVGSKAKTALLLVSTEVKSVFGDGKCVSGTDTCQLLEVEPGFPQTFVYGANDVRFKINVLKIEPVVTGHS